jgi:hypothetical protein
MNEQSEALRLADELETHAHHAMNGEAFYAAGKAAAELRRLQAEIESLKATLALYKMAEDAVTIGLSYNDWPKIGCVNHDCDQCMEKNGGAA